MPFYKGHNFDEFIKGFKWLVDTGTSHGAFTMDKLRNYINDRTKWDVKVLEDPLNLII